MYAKIIRRMMKDRGLTLKSLAEKAGMSQPNLSALLSGRCSPRLSSLEPLAKALEVRVADFLVPSEKHDFYAMIKTEGGFYTAEDIDALKFLIPIIEKNMNQKKN